MIFEPPGSILEPFWHMLRAMYVSCLLWLARREGSDEHHETEANDTNETLPALNARRARVAREQGPHVILQACRVDALAALATLALLLLALGPQAILQACCRDALAAAAALAVLFLLVLALLCLLFLLLSLP